MPGRPQSSSSRTNWQGGPPQTRLTLAARGWCMKAAGTVITALMVVASVACFGGSSSWSPEAIEEAEREAAFNIWVTNSAGSIALGPNRLGLAVLDRHGALMHDLSGVSLRLFKLDEDQGAFVSEFELQRSQIFDEDHHPATAIDESRRPDLVSSRPRLSQSPPIVGHEDPLATIYVGLVVFDQTQWWGGEVSFTFRDEKYEGLRTRFFVQERSFEPMIGETVPASRQQVLRDVPDISVISSATQPDPAMHRQTVVEAIQSGKPTLVGISTPEFCHSRFCGPVLEQVMRPILARYGDGVNVLHVEPFEIDAARAGQLIPIPMMREWNLTSEPWVFIIDEEGRLAAKFEGIVTEDEVAAVIEDLIKQ